MGRKRYCVAPRGREDQLDNGPRGHLLRALGAIQLASCIEFEQRSGLETTLITYDTRLAGIARLEGARVSPES